MTLEPNVRLVSPLFILPFLVVLLTALPLRVQAQLPTPKPTPDFMVVAPIGDWVPRGGLGVEEAACAALKNVGRLATGDTCYDVSYWNLSGDPRNINVYVEEVQEARWVLHEVELNLRRKKEAYETRTPDDKQRVPVFSFEQRVVEGQRVFFVSSGGYIWTSDPNRVVTIGWGRQKPSTGKYEPGVTFNVRELPPEFLDTYLGLLPSTLPVITFDEAHEQQFVRDAFDRDFEHAQRFLDLWREEGSTSEGYYGTVRAVLERIRDRRGLYFGGPSRAQRERQLLEQVKRGTDPRNAATLAFQQARHDELKAWWDAHRNDPIDLSRGDRDFDRDGLIGRQ